MVGPLQLGYKGAQDANKPEISWNQVVHHRILLSACSHCPETAQFFRVSLSLRTALSLTAASTLWFLCWCLSLTVVLSVLALKCLSYLMHCSRRLTFLLPHASLCHAWGVHAQRCSSFYTGKQKL